MADTSLLPARFLAWNMRHTLHISYVAQNRVVHANEVPESLTNKLPFPTHVSLKKVFNHGCTLRSWYTAIFQDEQPIKGLEPRTVSFNEITMRSMDKAFTYIATA